MVFPLGNGENRTNSLCFLLLCSKQFLQTTECNQHTENHQKNSHDKLQTVYQESWLTTGNIGNQCNQYKCCKQLVRRTKQWPDIIIVSAKSFD